MALINSVRSHGVCDSGQVADAPKQPAARPIFRISSLYETLFFPEKNRIAPLTNMAPPAAGLGNRAAPDWKALTLEEACAPPNPTTASPINPQPTRTVPMKEAILTTSVLPTTLTEPGLVSTALPDHCPRRNRDV